MWTYFPWPSQLLRAFVRKTFRKETFGATDEYRASIFHRLSYVYAIVAWSAVGVAIYLAFQPKVEVKEKGSSDNSLPFQEDIDKGGAIYWINALKSPEEMQNVQSISVIKMKGFQYQGTEDVTIKSKEIGQERSRRIEMLGHDFYLRKRYEIPLEKDGGPTNAELRQQFADQGKDYELELDFANQLNRVKTRYNPDGTVGEFIE